jgi:hypothetical protein
MNPQRELARVSGDACEFGLYPEHMHRLGLIARDILVEFEAGEQFEAAVQEYEDFVEKHVMCEKTFWGFHRLCMDVAGLTPQDASIEGDFVIDM